MSEDQLTEYHVVYTLTPYPRWEVQWGKRRMGYRAWDKRVAVSAAEAMAKKDRPSKVIIHDRRGPVQKELTFDPLPAKNSKK